MLYGTNALWYCSMQFSSSKLVPRSAWFSCEATTAFCNCSELRSRGNLRLPHRQKRTEYWQSLKPTQYASYLPKRDNDDGIGPTSSLHIQTLRGFPVEKLNQEIVLVRLDHAQVTMFFNCTSPMDPALATIKYLYDAGAKVLLISSWKSSNTSAFTKSLAGHLSSLLEIKVKVAENAALFMESKAELFEDADILLLDNLVNYKEEFANCHKFSEKLSLGVSIFVNEAFSLSHKILASTVGVPRFCEACICGFHFEEQLKQVLHIMDAHQQPYLAIIGGSNFLRKVPALHCLASKCDGMFFFGKIAFQIMNALGMSIPERFLELDAIDEALKLIHLAKGRNIPIYYASDFWCMHNTSPDMIQTFSPVEIMTGWTPIDPGPSSVNSLLSLIPFYKKVIWIDPAKFTPTENSLTISPFAQVLEKAKGCGCNITVVGCTTSNAGGKTDFFPPHKILSTTTVVWEFLKGRTLPGIAALDKAYPHHIKWDDIFDDPSLPLTVDIGSGNGFFLFNMARTLRASNFLGIEINEKLVKRCHNGVLFQNMKNIHFVAANATSTFYSIVSSYPGDLVLVSIQCPNPDFNKEEHRWRMVKKALVESIIDLLATNGKVFLQSDVEDVAVKLKDQFIKYGKNRIVAGDNEWLEENPLGVRSDWEQHVLARGAPMYRILLRKL